MSAAKDPAKTPDRSGGIRVTFVRRGPPHRWSRIEHAAIIAQAKAMIDYPQRYRFCPRCGALDENGGRGLPAALRANARQRALSAQIDPVVIMLAIHGEACLVGRGKQFPRGMFSALAGFVEPGETIEEAVRRELMEEASVKVAAVTYYATQPWPFPSSLMIGCFRQGREAARRKRTKSRSAEVRWI